MHHNNILFEIKINKWDLIKLKCFTAKQTINKLKDNPQVEENNSKQNN